MIYSKENKPDDKEPTGSFFKGKCGDSEDCSPGTENVTISPEDALITGTLIRASTSLEHSLDAVIPDEIFRVGSEMRVHNLQAYYGNSKVLNMPSFQIEANRITALIGPSGCGKSTFIRCLNRMHEVVKGAHATGEVCLDGKNIYSDTSDPVRVRRHIGMVFQKPNPFPTMSIYENVLAGVRLNRGKQKKQVEDEIVEMNLHMVSLWDEVKDKLNNSGIALSGGQQQRLCIARAIAVEPKVLLLDEPCSALDPIATQHIESLLEGLVERYTIVMVTHNIPQAKRISHNVGFMMADHNHVGQLVEYGPTNHVMFRPRQADANDHDATWDYVNGVFG